MALAFMMAVVFIIIGTCAISKEGKEQSGRLKGCSLICMCKYYGGYEDKMDTTPVSLFNDKNNNEIVIAFGNEERRVPIKDIKNLTTKKEEELRQEVTLGRFLLVGALAFLWKKNKVENRKFVIITYYNQDEDKDKNILFENSAAEIIYSKLHDIIKN